METSENLQQDQIQSRRVGDIIIRIQEKFKKNSMVDRIVNQLIKKQGKNSDQKEKENIGRKEQNTEESEKNFQILIQRREDLRKSKRVLKDLTCELNKLNANKAEQINNYTFSYSQNSSENLLEPLMKLKVFIQKEEELEATSKKCSELNEALQTKGQETQEALGKTKLKGLEPLSYGDQKHRAQKLDNNFIEKMIENFIAMKRANVLNDLEERESKQKNIEARRRKYEERWTEFCKQLEKQEPYLNKKIEDSVKKNLNIEEKRITLNRLQELVQNIKKEHPKTSQTKTSSQETRSASNENKDCNKENDVLVLLGQNRDSLRYIQALKIRINEFVASNLVATFEDLQKISKKLGSNLSTSSESWEKMYVLPKDIYYQNTPEENYSPVLQEMLDMVNNSNKAYFDLPLLISQLAQKKRQKEDHHIFVQNVNIQDSISKNQKVYQQRKRKLLGELVEIKGELEAETHYHEHLQRLLETCENPSSVEIASAVKYIGDRTLNDYLQKWQKLFEALSQEDY